MKVILGGIQSRLKSPGLNQCVDGTKTFSGCSVSEFVEIFEPLLTSPASCVYLTQFECLKSPVSAARHRCYTLGLNRSATYVARRLAVAKANVAGMRRLMYHGKSRASGIRACNRNFGQVNLLHFDCSV